MRWAFYLDIRIQKTSAALRRLVDEVGIFEAVGEVDGKFLEDRARPPLLPRSGRRHD